MYDASSGCFSIPSMDSFDLFQCSFAALFNKSLRFLTQQGQQISYRPNSQVKPYEKSYDRLNWWDSQTVVVVIIVAVVKDDEQRNRVMKCPSWQQCPMVLQSAPSFS